MQKDRAVRRSSQRGLEFVEDGNGGGVDDLDFRRVPAVDGAYLDRLDEASVVHRRRDIRSRVGPEAGERTRDVSDTLDHALRSEALPAVEVAPLPHSV